MPIERILLIDEVDEDNTVVVMSQSSLILRSLPVPPEKMKIDQQIARTCLIIKYQQLSPQKQKQLSRSSAKIRRMVRTRTNILSTNIRYFSRY